MTSSHSACACGCGFKLYPSMTVVWVEEKAYVPRCVKIGAFGTPKDKGSLVIS